MGSHCAFVPIFIFMRRAVAPFIAIEKEHPASVLLFRMQDFLRM